MIVRFNGFLFFLALFFFCMHSWGACTTSGYTSWVHCGRGQAGVCNDSGRDCVGGGFCGGSGFTIPSCSGNNSYLASVVNVGWTGGTTPVLCSAICGEGSMGREFLLTCCSTQAEADSIRCEQDPNAIGCTPPCDSTKWSCHTSVETSQTTIASDNITCFGGDCYGGTYCEYVTESTTECVSECGEIETQVASVPIRYEGACNPDNLTDEDECTGVKCISFSDSYKLFKLCKSREIVNGEQKFLPRFVGGGKGNCVNAGYPEADSSSFAGHPLDSASVPESCFTFGIGCPPKDTTDYTQPENRTDANCFCEAFDGQIYISRIVCPDGSISVFYGSCNEWMFPESSSSSTPPESSGSGSENPPSSSGGGVLAGDWINYSQGEDIKNALGVIISKMDKEQTINNVNSVNVALDDYTASVGDMSWNYSRTDSILVGESVIDSAGLVNAIFGRVDSVNTIIDTLQHPTAKCPCFTFFAGNTQTSFAGGHITLKEMKIDFADLWGIDWCQIVSVIVVALASVVSFFIGFAIFKNISQ